MTIGVRSCVRLLVCAALFAAPAAVGTSVPLDSRIATIAGPAAQDTELRGETGLAGSFPRADSDELVRALPTRPPMFIAREWE